MLRKVFKGHGKEKCKLKNKHNIFYCKSKNTKILKIPSCLLLFRTPQKAKYMETDT